jgi:hypothetical protein
MWNSSLGKNIIIIIMKEESCQCSKLDETGTQERENLRNLRLACTNYGWIILDSPTI